MNKLDEALKILYSSKSREIARRIVGANNADDVIQEVGVKLIRHAEGIREDGNISAYIGQAIRYTSINYTRSNDFKFSKEHNYGKREESKVPEATVQAKADSDVYANEVQTIVNEAFMIGWNSLSDKDKLAVKAFYGKAQTMDELAIEFDVNKSNVHRRVYRAREKMKEQTIFHFRHKINEEVPTHLIEFNLEGI